MLSQTLPRRVVVGRSVVSKVCPADRNRKKEAGCASDTSFTQDAPKPAPDRDAPRYDADVARRE